MTVPFWCKWVLVAFLPKSTEAVVVYILYLLDDLLSEVLVSDRAMIPLVVGERWRTLPLASLSIFPCRWSGGDYHVWAVDWMGPHLFDRTVLSILRVGGACLSQIRTLGLLSFRQGCAATLWR